jgi:predicted small secreted protein
MRRQRITPTNVEELAMMAKLAKLLFFVATLAVVTTPLTACNTMQGAGRDIEKAGSKLHDEAQEHKHY